MHADMAAVLDDACGDLQEPQPQRVELAPCERVALRDLRAHVIVRHLGRSMNIQDLAHRQAVA